jgi:hypothetical protein
VAGLGKRAVPFFHDYAPLGLVLNNYVFLKIKFGRKIQNFAPRVHYLQQLGGQDSVPPPGQHSFLSQHPAAEEWLAAYIAAVVAMANKAMIALFCMVKKIE